MIKYCENNNWVILADRNNSAGYAEARGKFLMLNGLKPPTP